MLPSLLLAPLVPFVSLSPLASFAGVTTLGLPSLALSSLALPSLTFTQASVLVTLGGFLSFASPANATSTSSFTRRSALPVNSKPPKFKWLFTANLKVLPNLAPLLPGPKGIRLDLPIVGGTFKGLENNVNGSILGYSADWATIDPLTGFGSTDARWIVSLPPTPSTQGVNSLIFVSTTGPSQKRGGLNRAHLRLIFETGVPEYYYLNNVLAVGVLEILNPSTTSVQDVRIDVFNFADDWSASDEVFTQPRNLEELNSYFPAPGFMAADSPVADETDAVDWPRSSSEGAAEPK
ncbi:hypothetical protein JCM5353_007319 [Sporobolomyces roseus]